MQRQELQNLTDIAMHLRQNIDATVNTYVTEIQLLINYIRAHVLPTVHNNQHASNLITAYTSVANFFRQYGNLN